jgi:ectoine hydroxylase-related dioxygenase (phytanoyl-CoA dioxygenase family)/uncharacterized cupin superfamily protein
MTDEELRRVFHERGYVVVPRLLDPEECRPLLAVLRQKEDAPPDWYKAWAVASPDWHALATSERALDLVRLLLGDDVLLWGASLAIRTPGQTHHWHCDIESSSPTAECVTAWIGLAGTNAGSSLKVVPYSHRFGMTIQQAAQAHGAAREGTTDGDVATWARELDRRSGVVTAEAGDGDAILFDGRLWHGSHNESPGERTAVLLQYATPRTPIRIPDFQRLAWPFELRRTPRPPCIVVSGRDVHGVNRVVQGPAARGLGLPALSAQAHSVLLPLEQDPELGWKPRHLFRGSSANVRSMGCHVSVLDSGRQPHPPHRHEEEEILVVLDGEADLVVEDDGDPEATRPVRARRGDVAYYPAGFAHTIHNTSRRPVTYVMFKWTTGRAGSGDTLPYRLVSLPPAAPSGPDGPKGFSPVGLLSGQTKHLRRLGAHVTTLQPGAGYEPHVDSYDVGIVLLEGTIETVGERLEPHGVVYYAGGEPHGMHNPGDTPAVYLVFEFQGEQSTHHRVVDDRPSFTRRLVRLARNPRRLKGALVHYARALGSRLG